LAVAPLPGSPASSPPRSEPPPAADDAGERADQRLDSLVEHHWNPPLSDKDRMLLGLQRIELGCLHAMRRLPMSFLAWCALLGVDTGKLYDPQVLGRLVGLTVDEYEWFRNEPMGRQRKGRPAADFSRRILPVGMTKTEARKHRRAFNHRRKVA